MNDHNKVTRRKFLEKAFTATVFATTIPSVVLGQARPILSKMEGTLAGRFVVNLSEFPILENDYGSVRLVIPSVSKKIILMRIPNDFFTAISEICTHEGCTLKSSWFDPEAELYTCQCHGSQFSADGSLQRGPALTSLPSYEVFYSGGNTVEIEVPTLSDAALAPIATEFSVHLDTSNFGTVSFYLTKAYNVLILVYSANGTEVLRVIDSYLHSGYHRIPFNSSRLHAGIYLCAIHTEQGFHTEKFVIAR